MGTAGKLVFKLILLCHQKLGGKLLDFKISCVAINISPNSFYTCVWHNLASMFHISLKFGVPGMLGLYATYAKFQKDWT